MVLTDKKSSELGRFAVTDELSQIGAFKTPTLRNVELTAPYMHDGSLKTLKEVMVHYNNGGVTKAGEQVNDFLSGGIRPLNLTDPQLDDLVAFMKALTSSKYAGPTPDPSGQLKEEFTMNTINNSRRNFIKTAGALAIGSTLPISLVELAFAESSQNFTFAYISDAHIQHIKDNRFVRNWDRGLIRAVAETNLLIPKPDFVMFGGDLAQLGSKAELDHGAEILSALHGDVHYVMGEHDYYLDLGEYWEKLFGPQYYSFDHKGVHFVVLNSIKTYDDWTFKRWPTAEQRMLEMAGLDNPNGSPFMVGEEQRLVAEKRSGQGR